MRALVTGGAGFIGSHLVRALLTRGDDVVVLDDLSSGHRHLLPDDVEFIEGSVARAEDVARAFERRPDCVLHLAALFANQNSVDHPVADLEANGLGTLNVLEASDRAGVGKIVNVSSSCVYGDREVMREDDGGFQLDTPYAITKLLGEQYAEFWASHHGLNVVSVRLFNAYGPHEYPGRYRNVVPNFLSLAMARRPLPITGTGHETRDFTYVADTVAGIVGVLLAETRAGDVFNVASGVDTSIMRLAEAINAITENPAGIELRPRRAWDRVTRRRADISKIQAACGYAPSVGLEAGLAMTFDWLERVTATASPSSG